MWLPLEVYEWQDQKVVKVTETYVYTIIGVPTHLR